MFDLPLSYKCTIVTVSVVDAPEFSGDPPAPNILGDPYTEISQNQRDKNVRLKKDEEERIRKKDAERKQRKKQKKEEAERQRKLKEAKEAREKEEELRSIYTSICHILITFLNVLLVYVIIPGKTEHCVFRGITMYDKTVWSPKQCVNCLCSSGEVVCDRILCPALQCQLKFQQIRECCPICIDPGLEKQVKDPYTEISQNQRDKNVRLKKDEEERIRKKDAERKQRKKRRMEEQRRAEEDRARRLELEQREMMRALEETAERAQEGLRGDEATEDEDVVWLRGDVFQMPPVPPTKMVTTLLPPGCLISDVTVTCENAKLTGIPPLSIPELKSLSLQGNEIKTIPAGAFNGIPNLEWIDLGKNKIVSSGIDPQALKGLKFLSRLYMDGNLLEQFPPELPSTLQELKINENNLKEIEENSFEGLSSLVTLEMEGNLLSEGNVNPQAFTPLKELTYIRLGRNHFRTIPQGLPASLLELYLENNLIEEISETAFNHTTNINVVVLRHNKLDESSIAPLAWINHRNLESLDLSHNNFYLVPSFLPKSLIHLVLAGNQIERIPGYVFAHMEPGLEYLYLSYNKLDGDAIEPESFLGTFNTMTELCLDHNQLTSIPMGINEMTTLHFLRLNNNKIRYTASSKQLKTIYLEISLFSFTIGK
uniref:Extracellular matrix protein 2 n=1 Tax=Sinocyclocheilus grahami TaxID=75366 RepID=A0A672QMV9_SINGR